MSRMHNLPVPPPDFFSLSPEFCHCGKRTVEAHDFWYCSTDCALADSLQSLGSDQCHYREIVRRAHALTRTQGPNLHRTTSVNHLRRAASERRGLPKAPPKNFPQKNLILPYQNAHDRDMAGSPKLTHATRKVPIHKANAGETLVAARQNLHKREGHLNASPSNRPVETRQENTFAQVSLDAIPLPEPNPSHSPMRMPQRNTSLKGSIRKSITALLPIGKSRRKNGDGENPEMIFGHHVNNLIPPTRKESLVSHNQKSSVNPIPSSKTLRRSASFAGWDNSNQDPVMQIIEEMRAEISESFDPKSLFELDDAY